MKNSLLMIAVACSLLACSGEPEAPRSPMVRNEGEILIVSETDKVGALKLATVTADQGGVLTLPGRLVWNEAHTVRIYPQLGGRVQSIAVDQGAVVKTGQVLATLLSPDYGQARADARRAEADWQLASKALARQRELREAGIIAEKEWQQSEAELVRAQAEHERARQRLAGLGGDGDGPYALRSPMAGIVVERNLNPGMEFRADGGMPPLFVVTDPTRLWLQLDASESDVRHLKPGEKVQIRVRQYPDERFVGVIERVADFVDPVSRTLKVRCAVDNADRRLKGEMFADALVELPPGGALRVPVEAVMLQGDQQVVLVEETPGRYRRQGVKAANLRDGGLDVSVGLQVGEKVVVDGNLNLIRYYRPDLGKAPAGGAAR